MNAKHRSNYAISGVVIVCMVTIAAVAFVAARFATPATSSVAVPPMDSGSPFLPTIANRTVAPAPPPRGMVWIAGGEF